MCIGEYSRGISTNQPSKLGWYWDFGQYFPVHIEKTVNGTVMQIEKAQINDRLRVSKEPWNFRIPTVYNFAVINPWNLLFSLKVAYFLTVSIVISV